jgi:hypothetical protein
MSLLLFTCPNTHHRASTGIETSVESLRDCWRRTVKVDCPYCGRRHNISVRKTYVDAALHDAVDRLQERI